MTLEQNNLHTLLQPRETDGYFNATLMCKAYGKHLPHWLSNQATKDVVNALSLEVGIPTSKLIEVVRGRGDKVQQGTWVHPDLAVQLAQWLDPSFALFVSRLVRDWFANHNKPKQPALPETYEAALEQLLETVRSKKALEQDLQVAQPKIEAYEDLVDSKGYFRGAEYAKMLGLGHIRLYRILRRLKIFKHNNTPYQPHIDAGRFVIKQSVFEAKGEKYVQHTTFATPKGVCYLRNRLINAGYLERIDEREADYEPVPTPIR